MGIPKCNNNFKIILYLENTEGYRNSVSGNWRFTKKYPMQVSKNRIFLTSIATELSGKDNQNGTSCTIHTN